MKRIIPVVILVILAGCGVNIIGIREDARVLGLKNVGSPVHYKITMAPMTPLYDRELFNEAQSKKEYAWIPEFDFDIEMEDIASLFEEFELFSEIRMAQGNVSSGYSDILEEAYDNITDFVLKLDLVRYKVSFDGFTGSYIPNMIGWFLLTPPTWFIHDERFKSEVFIKMELIDVFSRETIFERLYKGVEKRALNDFQRGWKLFGIFRTPGFLGPQNWQKIHKQLTPFALKKVKTAIIESIRRGDFQQFVQSTDFKEKIAKKIALCVGVSKYTDRKIPTIKFASNDAELMHRVLTDRENGTGINEAFCKLLINQQASKDDILNRINEIGILRSRKLDSFLFYFAGYGFIGSDGNGYLIPADCDLDRIQETAISIKELKEYIDKIEAKTIILVLDCSFSATQLGRSLTGTRRENNYDCLKPLVENERVLVVLAASPNQNAYEFESLRHGLFTYYICTGVSEKKGDMNLDSRIYLEEVYQFAKNNLVEISAYKGSLQEPMMLGRGDSAFLLYEPRKVIEEETSEEDTEDFGAEEEEEELEKIEIIGEEEGPIESSEDEEEDWEW